MPSPHTHPPSTHTHTPQPPKTSSPPPPRVAPAVATAAGERESERGEGVVGGQWSEVETRGGRGVGVAGGRGPLRTWLTLLLGVCGGSLQKNTIIQVKKL